MLSNGDGHHRRSIGGHYNVLDVEPEDADGLIRALRREPSRLWRHRAGCVPTAGFRGISGWDGSANCGARHARAAI